MFGSISKFCFSFIAGINLENLYKNNEINIKPFINKEITFFTAEKQTKFGKISVVLNNNIIEVHVPLEITATLEINKVKYEFTGKKRIEIGERV